MHMRKKTESRFSLSVRIMFALWIFLILVNILSRFLTSAVDFYIAWIFPAISDFWGSVSGLFSFSVGEFMIVAGVTLVILGIVSFILFMIFAKRTRRKIAIFYGHFYGWILTWLFFVLTFRFFILYQGTQMSQRLAGCRRIIISDENLPLLGTVYSYDDYDIFFREELAPLPVPQQQLLTQPDTIVEEPVEEEEEQQSQEENEDDFFGNDAPPQNVEPVDFPDDFFR